MDVPAGFARVTPYIFVDNATGYMDHLIAALGGTDAGRALRPDGTLANGVVRFGEASVFLSEASEAMPASRCSCYFYVADADAAMARAVESGMEEIMPATDMDYGDRQGGVRDRAGNVWWLSQRLTDQPYTH